VDSPYLRRTQQLTCSNNPQARLAPPATKILTSRLAESPATKLGPRQAQAAVNRGEHTAAKPRKRQQNNKPPAGCSSGKQAITGRRMAPRAVPPRRGEAPKPPIWRSPTFRYQPGEQGLSQRGTQHTPMVSRASRLQTACHHPGDSTQAKHWPRPDRIKSTPHQGLGMSWARACGTLARRLSHWPCACSPSASPFAPGPPRMPECLQQNNT